MSNKSSVDQNIINLPQGGGALTGMGEKFSPNLFTGTGNFSIPIAVPPGRNGLQPSLGLVYSTGQGNGPFGLGWSLDVPGVMRKVDKGVPIYDDEEDVFVLSGAEDLVAVPGALTGAQRYRPRTEGLFARIDHHKDDDNDYWKVWTKDGLISYYGTPDSFGSDNAVIADPDDTSKIFAWKLSKTQDPFGNIIEYEYERDTVQEDGPHKWDQLYLKEIRYADYDDSGTTRFLCTVEFNYADREDAFSFYNAGFEVRTVRRCESVQTYTHPSQTATLTKTFSFTYVDERVTAGELDEEKLPLNGMSLLSRVIVTGHDGTLEEDMPPLDFNYTLFQPENADLEEVAGNDLPYANLSNPDFELADVFGNGLPDIIQLNGVARYWRNLGNGTFDVPRNFKDAPAGVKLADPNVQMLDANGDGLVDLMVHSPGRSGYFPLRYTGEWDRNSYRKHQYVPSFSFADPEVKMMDLDGDGVTDVLRNGERFELFINDRDLGFQKTKTINKSQLEDFPNVSFADPRVRIASMAGSLSDIVLIHKGRIEYWPYMGHGKWGKPVVMENAPVFPDRYNPGRIMIGDVDGDGLSDIIYLENNKITLWINQSGNGWSDPIEIKGTPELVDPDAVRLVDLKGQGVAGILWTRDAEPRRRSQMLFLDFNHGGTKPYLLDEMNNNMGAITKVAYASSTDYYLADYSNPDTRWETPLPMPVLVVAKTEVIDEISGGKMTSEYSYHHGYYDGAEREFRGFGRVDQRDTETFDNYNANGLHGTQAFNSVSAAYFSPPTETRVWHNLGPVGDEEGDWEVPDFSNEYWSGDENIFSMPAEMKTLLEQQARRDRRDAWRVLRGTTLRTELYALDGTLRQDKPYSVTEGNFAVAEVVTLDDSGSISTELSFDGSVSGNGDRVDTGDHKIWFAYGVGNRSTAWERGDEPMTQLGFSGDFDNYGFPRKQISIAVPFTRKNDYTAANGGATESYLSTYGESTVIHKDDNTHYLIGRVSEASSYEVVNDGTMSALVLASDVLDGSYTNLELIGHTLNYFDGTTAYTPATHGTMGDYGVITQSDTLVLTDDIISEAYPGGSFPSPVYIEDASPSWGSEYPTDFRNSVDSSGAFSGTRAGYVVHNISSGNDGYYVRSRSKFDFQDSMNSDPRGLLEGSKDPYGNEGTISYDGYKMFAISTTDAAGMTVSASIDYRVMAPDQITDPNGNRRQVEFSPLGLPAKQLVLGKSSESKGDTSAAPGVELQYDFYNWLTNQEPVFVKSIAREYHKNGPNSTDDSTISKIEFTDGFGRLLQTRTQAETVIFGDQTFGDSGLPVSQASSNADAVGTENTSSTNVVVSGATVYDNKGRVVESYEPFFDTDWDYAAPTIGQTGKKVIQYYDVLGRVVRTVNPDDTEQWNILGRPDALETPGLYSPTPWESWMYDANDLADLTHSSHNVPDDHLWTPRTVKVDALGRQIETIDRFDYDGGTNSAEEVVMQYTFDIRGNVLQIDDAIKIDNPSGGRASVFTHVYDLKPKTSNDDPGANVLRTDHIDSGTKTVVFDGTLMPVELRDSKGSLILNGHDDDLRRQTRMWTRDTSSDSMVLSQKMVFGDDAGLGSPENLNLKGKLYEHYDEAGRVTFDEYDFKGNLLDKTREVIKNSTILATFTGPPWSSITPYRVDWTTASGVLEGTYQTEMEYDALNRVTKITLPSDLDSTRKEIVPTYNRAGTLKSIDLDSTAYVEHIAYNAKGQRLLVAYGNDVMQRYAYDEDNFRLLRIRSEKYTKTGWTYAYQSGTVRQDNEYTFDLAGNIVNLVDASSNAGVGGSGTLDRDFSYDALYRLLTATGRCSAAYQSSMPSSSTPWSNPSDNTAANTVEYQRTYTYDKLGNMLQMEHDIITSGQSGDFNRYFNDYDTAPSSAFATSNEMAKMKVGSNTWTYTYDSNGNMITEGSTRNFGWDHSDQLRVFFNQSGSSQPTEYAHYLYDSAGNRVKKLVRKSSGNEIVSIYIDGLFDYLYEIDSSSNVTEEYNELHVMDGRTRIARKAIFGSTWTGSTSDPVKYNLEDHLGNASVTLSSSGTELTREEYFPFGETSFGSYSRKRYRFVGKERDEESGFYYYGARYYAPWVHRFVSTDPLAVIYSFYTPYQYAGNKPINFIDVDGLEEGLGGPNENGQVKNADNKPGITPQKNSSLEPEKLLTAYGGNVLKEYPYSGITVHGVNYIFPDAQEYPELLNVAWFMANTGEFHLLMSQFHQKLEMDDLSGIDIYIRVLKDPNQQNGRTSGNTFEIPIGAISSSGYATESSVQKFYNEDGLGADTYHGLYFANEYSEIDFSGSLNNGSSHIFVINLFEWHLAGLDLSDYATYVEPSETLFHELMAHIVIPYILMLAFDLMSVEDEHFNYHGHRKYSSPKEDPAGMNTVRMKYYKDAWELAKTLGQ